MLKKLYKHEFYSLFRSLLPIYAALFGFSVLSRLVYLIKTENNIINTFKTLAVIGYVLTIIAVFVVGIVIVVTRFYKNLLSKEGYLTFSLPFTATQHIICKLVCGAVTLAVDFLLVMSSFIILGIGTKAENDLFKAIPQMLGIFFSYGKWPQITLLIAEIALFAIIKLLEALLMFYAGIAIGQQFKNKIGASVIAYICLYAASQIISLIFVSLIITVFSASVFENYMNSGISAVSTFMLFPLILSALYGTAYFFTARYFLSKKLNLE